MLILWDTKVKLNFGIDISIIQLFIYPCRIAIAVNNSYICSVKSSWQMQKRHTNKSQYFKEQAKTTEKFVIPFIENVKKLDKSMSILEIGCGEAGNLLPFVEQGYGRVVGIDLSPSRIEKAKGFYKERNLVDKIELIASDIYKVEPESLGRFDVIVMRDVIEHIHDQEKFMGLVKKFLSDDGKFFLGFPPWYNPFGGHQQTCKGKVLSKLPFYHILPMFMYKGILKLGGESEQTIESLVEIKETGISLERFEGILKRTKYKIDYKTHFLFNPNYETKFGLKPRILWPIFTWIPFFRNFYTTAGYYLVSNM